MGEMLSVLAIVVNTFMYVSGTTLTALPARGFPGSGNRQNKIISNLSSQDEARVSWESNAYESMPERLLAGLQHRTRQNVERGPLDEFVSKSDDRMCIRIPVIRRSKHTCHDRDPTSGALVVAAFERDRIPDGSAILLLYYTPED